MLGSIESTADRTVVADFEAGIGTLTRMPAGGVDVVLVVVEPTAKSLEVGRRAAALVEERELGRLIVVANRVREEAEHMLVREMFPGAEVVAVPDDPGIIAADREGVAPIDVAPDSPAVVALAGLAKRLILPIAG